jgi:hypothetical protein
MELDMGDEEELDLTGASDDEVIAVFKKMSDEDEVEVVKDVDGIHLTDNETGAEYYIKEGYDQIEEDEDCIHEGAGCSKHMDEDEVMYEIELDEMHGSMMGDQSADHSDYKNYKGTDKGYHGHDGSSHGDQGEPDDYMGETLDLDEEEAIEEDKLKRHQSTGYQRRSGAKVGSDQASPYGGVSESKKRRTPKNVKRVSESKIMKEYKELKSKNEEYKGALKVFKNKLNEVALFNTNLAYVNRLFTEHSTTKSEKMEILKRFDSAESIKESKSIYKSVKSELDTKSPITESVENKVNKTVKSSKSDLNESTAYVDPQITAIKDLMRKLS